MSKYSQISIFTGKRQLWRPFKYKYKHESLQVNKKVTPLQMLSCKLCEVLQSAIFKEDCWVTASNFEQHLEVSLILSAINNVID